jgi:hypothetical protein
VGNENIKAVVVQQTFRSTKCEPEIIVVDNEQEHRVKQTDLPTKIQNLVLVWYVF